MKKTFYLCFFLLTLQVGAQGQSAFPDSNAVWTNLIRGYDIDMSTNPWTVTYEPWVSTSFVMGTADTLIDGQSYDIITYEGMDYVGAIRTVDQSVTFVLHDQVQEYTLYDFSAEVGDTIVDIIYFEDGQTIYNSAYFSTHDLYVYNVDSITLEDGIQRKRLELESMTDGAGYEWIEGIGCTNAFLWLAGLNVSNYEVEFGRFCQDGSTVYESGFATSTIDTAYCTAIVVDDLMEPNRVEFDITPNPTAGQFTLTLSTSADPHSPSTIFIRDTHGRLVDQHTIERGSVSSRFSMDISHLPAGLYTVSRYSESVFGARILVKE